MPPHPGSKCCCVPTPARSNSRASTLSTTFCCKPGRSAEPWPSTLNHQPSTLNPQPSTLNPQPCTLNPDDLGPPFSCAPPQRKQRTAAEDSHGARPVHLIITMIKWIQTSRLSIKNSLCRGQRTPARFAETFLHSSRPSVYFVFIRVAIHARLPPSPAKDPRSYENTPPFFFFITRKPRVE